MRFAHFKFDPDTDRLGEGPLSEVYRAEDLHLGRTVALKILRAHAEIDPQADTRFLREAKHTSNLEHPNIATIYEYGQAQGTSFIAMEYLQGRTLDKVVRDHPLGFEECVRIALQVTEALKLVHKSQLIHRDLKPANILLQDDGKVKLLDFGIARARDESGITQHGMLVGTVLYMSPEQVRGEELDFRSDIFSLGAVLYHVSTGHLPFPGDSFPEVCMAILEGRPQLPSEARSGLPQPFEDLLLRCLDADPDQRYQDARECHAALNALSDTLSGTNTRAATAVRGRIVIEHLQVTGSDLAASAAMAGSVRKDMAAELSRNKSVQVILLGEGEPMPDSDEYDCVVHGVMEADGRRGELKIELEIRGALTAAGESKLLTETFEHFDDDEWALQAALVRSAVRSVKRHISDTNLRPVLARTRKVEEANQAAHLAYDVMHRGTTKHILAAMNRFRGALDLDHGCALAHAGTAEALVRKYLNWDGEQSFLDESREHSGRALTLDPGCARAHTALGFAYHLSGHSMDAQREYTLAIEMDKDEWLAHRLLGAVRAREGNFKHASPLLVKAIGLKPTHIASYDHLFTVLDRLDRHLEALEYADKGISVARKYLAKVPDDQNGRLHAAMLMARMGQVDSARAQVEEARKRAPKDGYTAFNIASVFAIMNELGESMEALTLAQARGFYIKSELARNRDFDVLRGLPAFDELTA